MGNEHPSCFRCGTCCIAPDISTLRKPVGAPCPHLLPNHLCGIYPDRPPVCRDYQPDEICLALQLLPAEERVAYFLNVYGLTDENESIE
jgi:Fe-S-cluster containining protein